MSVTVLLEDHVAVSRGDMVCRPNNPHKPSQNIDAMICWMNPEPLKQRRKLAIKHTPRTGRALATNLQYPHHRLLRPHRRSHRHHRWHDQQRKLNSIRGPRAAYTLVCP